MTRWGIVADVHGNLPALETALEHLHELGSERLVSAGDTIGYGPHPNECVARLTEVGAIQILGNHELFVLGRISGDRFVERARRALAWTQGVLSDSTRDHIGGLPDRFTEGELVVAHAALDSAEEYILTRGQAARQFAHMRDVLPDARLLILGHTHQPAAFRQIGHAVRRLRVHVAPRQLETGHRYLLNPGSVGQSRQLERHPRVRFMLLDTSTRTARWYAVPYDYRRTRHDLERAGLPADWVHARPSAWRALRRLARRVVR